MARKKTEEVKAWKARRKRDYTGKLGDPAYRGSPNMLTSAHGKLRKKRGLPKTNTCVECGKPATRWTLQPRRGAEIFIDPRDTFFSCDPADYEPRCAEHAGPHQKKVKASLLKKAAGKKS